MTIEERLQQLLGQQAFTIVALQAELEKVKAELVKKEPAPEKPSLRSVE